MTTKWLSQYSNLVNNMPSELTFFENTIDPTLLHRVCTAGGSHLLLFILENELKLPLTKENLANVIIIFCLVIYYYFFFYNQCKHIFFLLDGCQ